MSPSSCRSLCSRRRFSYRHYRDRSARRLAVLAAGVNSPTTVIVVVIVSGAFIGINNTLTTHAVMLISPVERPVASSAYGFVRFIGGGLAPYAAGKLADAYDLSVPFYVGAGAFALAIVVLATGHRLLADAEQGQADGETVLPRLRPRLEAVGDVLTGDAHPVIVAVAATSDAAGIVASAARLAQQTGSPLEVVHVRETAVVEEQAVEVEDADVARSALTAHLDRLAEQHIRATGLLLHSVGDHAEAGRVLARHAQDVRAGLVAVGTSPRGAAAQFGAGSLTTALTRHSPCTVVLLRLNEPARELTDDTVRALAAR